MEITVKLTTAQEQALAYVALDPVEYVTAGIEAAIHRAMDDIVSTEVQRKLNLGEPIPGSRDEIIEQAFEMGRIQTAAQRQEQSEAAIKLTRLEGNQP